MGTGGETLDSGSLQLFQTLVLFFLFLIIIIMLLCLLCLALGVYTHNIFYMFQHINTRCGGKNSSTLIALSFYILLQPERGSSALIYWEVCSGGWVLGVYCVSVLNEARGIWIFFRVGGRVEVCLRPVRSAPQREGELARTRTGQGGELAGVWKMQVTVRGKVLKRVCVVCSNNKIVLGLVRTWFRPVSDSSKNLFALCGKEVCACRIVIFGQWYSYWLKSGSRGPVGISCM